MNYKRLIGRPPVYPFGTMDIGEMISVASDDAMRVHSAASGYKRHNADWDYTFRKQSDGSYLLARVSSDAPKPVRQRVTRFDKLRIGESVTAPQATALSLRVAASQFKACHAGWDYFTRRLDDGSMYVERTA